MPVAADARGRAYGGGGCYGLKSVKESLKRAVTLPGRLLKLFF